MLLNRKTYLIFLLLTLAAGLASRSFSNYLPAFVNIYLGDALWALLVYFLLRFLWPQAKLGISAVAALLFSYLVEMSQLYHDPWIDTIRHTTLGGLVLGFGFLWTDIVAYTLCVMVGAVLDFSFLQRKVQPAELQNGNE